MMMRNNKVKSNVLASGCDKTARGLDVPQVLGAIRLFSLGLNPKVVTICTMLTKTVL